MPYTVVHLRWSEVDPGGYEKACAALSDHTQLPAGCRSRHLSRQGTAMFDTEVWSGADAAREFLDRLPEIVAAAGIGAPSHTASYPLLDVLAAGYLRADRSPGQPAFPVVLIDGVPQQPTPRVPTTTPRIPSPRRPSTAEVPTLVALP